MTTRITGGSLRGQKLRSARSAGLRPTTERVRSAIFSMLGRNMVEGARVLDLYSGTGALGIEALSRGAAWADFVESHPRRCREIRETLGRLGLLNLAGVHRARSEKALKLMEGTYELILADPPYSFNKWESLVQGMEDAELLSKEGLLVLEHRTASPLADSYGGLGLVTTLRHGDSSVSVYK